MVDFETTVYDRFGVAVQDNSSVTVTSVGWFPSYSFKGKIDEIRLSTGICRHSSTFSPPSEAYTLLGGSPTKTVGGLSHLEGKTVNILGDGNVETSQVVSNATVTLSDYRSVVHIGLPYNSDLETLNIEQQSDDGTSQGKRILVSRIVMRLMNSRGGSIGPDFDDMNDILDEAYASVLNSSLFTGDIKANLGQGYKDGGRFCFRQSDPLPITILGVMPVITLGGSSGV